MTEGSYLQGGGSSLPCQTLKPEPGALSQPSSDHQLSPSPFLSDLGQLPWQVSVTVKFMGKQGDPALRIFRMSLYSRKAIPHSTDIPSEFWKNCLCDMNLWRVVDGGTSLGICSGKPPCQRASPQLTVPVMCQDKLDPTRKSHA